MQNPSSVHLDSQHCRAICDEIGERLCGMLDSETAVLPESLKRLLARLEELDDCAPSIVPSAEEMRWLPVAEVRATAS